jgi:long-chain acyl-CoA synthetase
LISKYFNEFLFFTIRRIAAGGAAASLEVLQFFEDIGLPVIEGYGLSETAPTVTAGSIDWENRRLGCVGVPVHGIDLKIVDPVTLQPLPSDTDGEITVSGPIVMKGYHKKPEATKEVFFTLNGQTYFRTGDLGRMVEGKFLKITGRIKDQYKLVNGKFVVPTPLEDILSRGPLIAQCFLYGNNKEHNILLVVPNYSEWYQLAQGQGKQEIVGLLPKEALNNASALQNFDISDAKEKENIQKLFENPFFVEAITKEVRTTPNFYTFKFIESFVLSM